MLLPLLATALPLAVQGDVAQTVVTAPRSQTHTVRSDAVVTVIEGEELERTGERSLPRALGKVAGVWIQETNLGGGAPIVNGQIGNRVLIVVDGVRLNDSTTRNGPNQSLNGIDPETVDRIEVIRGPSSVLYGSDAVGGVLLIWTKNRAPGSTGPLAKLDVDGSTATRGGRVSITGAGADEKAGWIGVASYQSFDDLRSGAGEVDNTGYDGYATFGSLQVDLGPYRDVRIVARRTRDFDIPRTDRLNAGFGQTQPPNVEWDYALQDREGYLLSFTDNEPGALAERVQARLSLRRYREERVLRRTGSSVRRLEADQTTTLGLGVDWQGTFGEDHLLTWGFDFDVDDVDSRRRDLDLSNGQVATLDGAFAPDARYASTGVFLQDEIFSFSPWDVVLGVRYSYFDFGFDPFGQPGGGRVDGDFDALTTSVSMGREVFDGVRVTGTVAQGFRAPNLDDLANNGQFAGGVELGNPDLDPEESVTAQFTVDVVRDSWSGYAGVHFTSIDELIGRRLVDAGNPGTTGDETYRRDNVGRAKIVGADAGYRRRLGGDDSPWTLDTSATWTVGRQFDDTIDPNTGTAPFDDVPFRRIPPLFGRVGLGWRPASTGGIDWVELTWRFAFEQDDLHPEDVLDPRIDPNGTDGWSVVDVDLGGALRGVVGSGGEASTWTLGLHNLFDEAYRVHASGYDAPGIALVFGLHLRF